MCTNPPPVTSTCLYKAPTSHGCPRCFFSSQKSTQSHLASVWSRSQSQMENCGPAITRTHCVMVGTGHGLCRQCWFSLSVTCPLVLCLSRKLPLGKCFLFLCIIFREETMQVTQWLWTQWSTTSTCCPVEYSTRRLSPSSVGHSLIWDRSQ